jgi:ARG/rhodanese/phosphatase superfamily protein
MFGKPEVCAALVALCLIQGGAVRAESDSPDGYRVSEPAVHGNLAVYFVHGKSQSGPVPLTLQEALAKKVVEVREIGNVNELQVRNTGKEEIFIQAGDIVKGGQQDRVLSVSLVLPPRSGPIPISSFCVEAGRWSARGTEDKQKFSSADAALPSRNAKLEMAGAKPEKAAPTDPAPVAARQDKIWKSVKEIQGKLSTKLGAPVEAAASQTSLQLSLENERLKHEQADYITALQPAGERDDDIVGFVFAVNGKVNSADIYPSNALFRKMWPKLLRASITEAIGERDGAAGPVPTTGAVSSFITSADRAGAVQTSGGEKVQVRKRESDAAVLIEAAPPAAPAGRFVHRNYLAK